MPNPLSPVLDALCNQFPVWTTATLPSRIQTGRETGFTSLDACLPGKGWPTSELIELLADRHGIGELSLLLPALALLSREKGVLLIAPPFIPYAPALVQAGVDLSRLLVAPSCPMRDALACAELALRSGACSAVLLWESGLTDHAGRSVPPLALRRLHLAADRGTTMAVLFRPARQAAQPSPAVLRILLRQAASGLELTLFKRRGMFGEARLTLCPHLSSLQAEMAHPPWHRLVPERGLASDPRLAAPALQRFPLVH